KEIGISNADVAAYLRSLTAGEYYGPRQKWPAYLPYRPGERLFFNAYTYEQVEAYVKANPTRWMANPYAGSGTAVSLEGDLGVGYVAHGAGTPPRIEGTHYFYRDGSELEEERETFETLPQP